MAYPPHPTPPSILPCAQKLEARALAQVDAPMTYSMAWLACIHVGIRLPGRGIGLDARQLAPCRTAWISIGLEMASMDAATLATACRPAYPDSALQFQDRPGRARASSAIVRDQERLHVWRTRYSAALHQAPYVTRITLPNTP
jgi:hypothetical protein